MVDASEKTSFPEMTWQRYYDDSWQAYCNVHSSKPDDVWVECYDDDDGSLYFYSTLTEGTSWDLPVHTDEETWEETQAKRWLRYIDDSSGCYYYVNVLSGVAEWELPHGGVVVDGYDDDGAVVHNETDQYAEAHGIAKNGYEDTGESADVESPFVWPQAELDYGIEASNDVDPYPEVGHDNKVNIEKSGGGEEDLERNNLSENDSVAMVTTGVVAEDSSLDLFPADLHKPNRSPNEPEEKDEKPLLVDIAQDIQTRDEQERTEEEPRETGHEMKPEHDDVEVSEGRDGDNLESAPPTKENQIQSKRGITVFAGVSKRKLLPHTNQPVQNRKKRDIATKGAVMAHNMHEELRVLFCSLKRESDGSVSREKLLRAFASDGEWRDRFRNIQGMEKLFRPSRFHMDLNSAKKKSNETLTETNFIDYCKMWRTKPKVLRPYHERVRPKVEDQLFETLKIRIKIPDMLRGSLCESYETQPYAHLERRARRDAEFKARLVAFKKRCNNFKRQMESLKLQEERTRSKFDLDMKRTEERELRQRKSTRGLLARKNMQDLRRQTVRKIVAINESAGRKKQVPTSDVTEVGDTMVTADQLENMKISLGKVERENFENWFQNEKSASEVKIEQDMERLIAKQLKTRRKRAKAERKRRQTVDSKLAEEIKAQQDAESTFRAETEEMERVERELRRLENDAYSSMIRQRQHYLKVASSCFDRALLRRVSWCLTLKEYAAFNRTIHLLKDHFANKHLVLITFACPVQGGKQTGAHYVKQVVEKLEVFKQAATTGYLSAAQRKDDRMTVPSRFLVEIESVFAHRLDTHFQIFIMTKYYPQQRLKDVLVYLYGDKNVVRQPSESDIVDWTEQLARAVRALHDRGIAHRGIEPGCIFFDSAKRLKLGLPKDIRGIGKKNNMDHATAAPPSHYSPPEIFDPNVDFFKADVWSIGAVVYHLATGQYLPSHTIPLSSVVTDPVVSRYQRWFRNFLRMSLQRRPQDRASILDIVDFFSFDAADAALLVREEAITRKRKETPTSTF